ncbi:MAG: hypothetical protein QXE80_07795, partial [Pyrobaculum sp.]
WRLSYLDTAPSFTTLDFVVSRDPPLLIQVTHASAPDEVDRREIEAIREAKKAIGGEALVVTWDYGGELGGVSRPFLLSPTDLLPLPQLPPAYVYNLHTSTRRFSAQGENCTNMDLETPT